MNQSPTASIIISAYNRPKVVCFAIQSVLASDFDDWELIIVGDGCNAETEAAIRSFTDPRIRFHNLPENTGHQSAPHNKGVEMARGKYVLYLNQDDMFFPDHIRKRIAFMDVTGADISWSPILLLQHSARDHGPVDPATDILGLDGAVADGQFDPRAFVISSCWAVRRTVCDQVGAWLPISETRLSPSQEWLFRAHKMGMNMVFHRHVSVLCIHSGVRRYSYVSSESPEHTRGWEWICAGAQTRVDLLNCAAVNLAGGKFALENRLDRRKHRLRSLVQKLARKRGIHPHSVERFLSGMKKGAWVNNHTKFTKGAPPKLRPDHPLGFAQKQNPDIFGRGWHDRAREGRWSAQEAAELIFTADHDNQTLKLTGHPLGAGDAVKILVNGSEAEVEIAANTGAPSTLLVGLPNPGLQVVVIIVENPTTPKALGMSSENRILGFHLQALELTISNAAPAERPQDAAQIQTEVK